MSPARKKIWINLKRNSPFASKAFCLALFFFSILAAAPPDNAQWAKEILVKKISLPDSLLNGNIRIDGVRKNNLNELVRQALLENIKPAANSTDSADCRLEFHITRLDIAYSKLYRDGFFKARKADRTLRYDIDLHIFRGAALQWSGKITGSEKEPFRYRDAAKIASGTYPALNGKIKTNHFISLLDGVIFTGSVASIVYFLYK